MPIPIQKVLLTSIRYTMRPINNTIMKSLKSKDKDSYGYIFFSQFGQKANVFEVKMNRALIGAKGLDTIKPLGDDIAFTKGVEWFTEVFIFYGILISIACFELKKAAASSAKTKQMVTDLVAECKQQESKIQELNGTLVEVESQRDSLNQTYEELNQLVDKLENDTGTLINKSI